VLIRLEGNKYRFWLDVDKGWPSYNLGTTDGTITFMKDTASFDNTYEDAKKSCILKFRVTKNAVHISSQSASSDCGFGNAVMADGVYTKWKVQPKLNNAWLKDQYFEAPKVLITANKTILYKDENAVYPTTQTFAKGETLLNIAETEKTIYTERFTASGKFVYGWIKKSAVKMADTD
jgi:peptide methionine sulfoxide reductase MsrB